MLFTTVLPRLLRLFAFLRRRRYVHGAIALSYVNFFCLIYNYKTVFLTRQTKTPIHISITRKKCQCHHHLLVFYVYVKKKAAFAVSISLRAIKKNANLYTRIGHIWIVIKLHYETKVPYPLCMLFVHSVSQGSYKVNK